MRRRQVLIGLIEIGAATGVAAVTTPAMAQRSPKVPHVGVLTPAQTDATPIFDGLRKGLRDLGYIDGQSITLDFRCAKGNLDALPGLAAELVHIPVDLIVTDGNSAAKVAQEATRTIPIVMGVAAGALESGIVRSIARPGGNITGVSLGRVEQSGKRLELLKAAYPDVRVVAVLFNSMSVAGQISLPFVEDAAKKLGMTLIPLTARNPDELRELQSSRLAGANGFVVLPDAMFWNHRGTIVALANASRVPAVYPERDYVDDGGLIAFGPNIPDSFRRAAGYVDRILRGASPGDLPVDEASKFDFVVNLRAARALGLSPTAEFLVRVDEVIE